MRTQSKLNRRKFIQLSALSATGATLAACTPIVQDTQSPTGTTAITEAVADTTSGDTASIGYQEAPMLTERVANGALPPVQERLPERPFVLDGMEGIGQYGGHLRRAFKGVSDRGGPTKLVQQGLVWYTPDLTLRPNVIESWEVNENATVWTFHLRPGMKWSDGHSFDAESFRWWYENVFLHPKLTKRFSTNWSTGTPATPMKMDFPDQYTVVISFSEPKPLFLHATAVITTSLYIPGHYMAKYHMKTAPDRAALEAEIAEKGFNNWRSYFNDRNQWHLNPERPTIYPFVAQNTMAEELFTVERNPYFWQVDSAGNQLPYLDTMNHRLFQKQNVFDLWCVNGEIDFQQRHVELSNLTLYRESESSGGYRTQSGVTDQHIVLSPNLTCKDERLREFFNQRDVRIALSLAVDRERMNEIVYDGLMTPRQYSPLQESAQAYPKQAESHIAYDPEKANSLLDVAGYSKRDSDGFRLHKDGSGETLSFVINGAAKPGSDHESAIVLMTQDLAAVGIKTIYKGLEKSLLQARTDANDYEATSWTAGQTLFPLVRGTFFIGIAGTWSGAWRLWKSDPTNPNGEKPPEGHWIWDIWNLWDLIEIATDPIQQNQLFTQLLDIWAEELPQIGYLGQQPSLTIVKEGLRNLDPNYQYVFSGQTNQDGLIPIQTFYWDIAS